MGRSPRDRPILPRWTGRQLASGVGMRADQGPDRQEMGVVEDNGPVDTGQFDQLPFA